MITQKIAKKIKEKVSLAHNLAEDFGINNRIIENHNNYQKFVILCSGRSGSNFLLSLLQSHTKTRVYNEVFHFHKPVWGYSGMKYKNSAERLELREKNITEYIAQELYGQYPKNIEAAGFKLLYSHMEKNREAEQWRQEIANSLNSFDNLKIIHLQRKNLLKGCLSSAIAFRDNRWTAKDENKLRSIPPIKLSHQQCLDYFDYVQNNRRKYAQVFSAYPTIDVYYEDLCADIDGITREIQDFLGIELQKMLASTKKIVKSPLSVQISNYQELKKTFINTAYEEYFTE